MPITGTLLNVVLGIISGVISGFIVSFYFWEKDRNNEFIRCLYELHMYLSQLKMLLDDYKLTKNKEKLKEILIMSPVPTFLRLKNLPITDEAKKSITNANTVIHELKARIMTDDNALSERDINAIKSDLFRASFNLLKVKQTH